MIEKLHGNMPKYTGGGNRLQMMVCSATLHDFDVKKMAVSTVIIIVFYLIKNYFSLFNPNLSCKDRLMHFPTWVDLKGEDAVPETVHHVVVKVDPQKDLSWQSMMNCFRNRIFAF